MIDANPHFAAALPLEGRSPMKPRMARFARTLFVGVLLVLSVGASQARPAAPSVTLNMLAIYLDQPAYDVLIPNFERVYPNITVNVTYAPSEAVLMQLETTELAAGNAPDLLGVTPGCGSTNAICEFAGAGELAPLVKEPWVKRSLPLVTSMLKHGEGLFAFQPIVSPFGVFTNNDLFGKLGLKVPQTFSQLLTLCQKARADGTTALVLPGSTTSSPSFLIYALVTASLYGRDRNWNSQLKSGAATFDGTAGWRQAVQEVSDMNAANCFQPGLAGESGSAATALFASGGGLMEATTSIQEGQIASSDPSFGYTFRPFPSGSDPSGTNTFINISDAVAVNAHSSAQNQSAARTFIDFIARPKQDALFAQLTGGLTQYQFLKQDLPAFMSPFATVVKRDTYVIRPSLSWWNGGVSLALQTDAAGLFTGQTTADDVLKAMDAAWKQGPS